MELARKSLRRTISTLGVAAALSAASFTLTTTAGAETIPGDGMTLVGVNAFAAAQPTATGRQLLELEVVDGKVWAGYGDYGANTGPITLSAYDPTTAAGFEPAFTVDTEAVYNISDLGGEVVAPATDPRSQADFAMSGPWRQARPFGATHVFDSATLDGTDLWMVGSRGYDAVAWRSLDGGTTWAESLRIAPNSGLSGDFNRFYFAGVAGGKLYVQTVGSKSYDAPTSMVFDGSTWSEGPDLLPTGGFGWDAEPLGDGFVLHTSGHGWAGGVVHFDGQSARQVVSNAYDVAVTGEAVWVLMSDGAVQRSSDLLVWATVLVGPANGRSLAVDVGSVYVGTTSSDLWSAAIPAGDLLPPTTTPEVITKVRGPKGPAPDTQCSKGWANRGRC